MYYINFHQTSSLEKKKKYIFKRVISLNLSERDRNKQKIKIELRRLCNLARIKLPLLKNAGLKNEKRRYRTSYSTSPLAGCSESQPASNFSRSLTVSWTSLNYTHTSESLYSLKIIKFLSRLSNFTDSIVKNFPHSSILIHLLLRLALHYFTSFHPPIIWWNNSRFFTTISPTYLKFPSISFVWNSQSSHTCTQNDRQNFSQKTIFLHKKIYTNA